MYLLLSLPLRYNVSSMIFLYRSEVEGFVKRQGFVLKRGVHKNAGTPFSADSTEKWGNTSCQFTRCQRPAGGIVAVVFSSGQAEETFDCASIIELRFNRLVAGSY